MSRTSWGVACFGVLIRVRSLIGWPDGSSVSALIPVPPISTARVNGPAMISLTDLADDLGLFFFIAAALLDLCVKRMSVRRFVALSYAPRQTATRIFSLRSPPTAFPSRSPNDAPGMRVRVEVRFAQEAHQRHADLVRQFDRQRRGRRHRTENRDARRRGLLHDLEAQPPAYHQHVMCQRSQAVGER